MIKKETGPASPAPISDQFSFSENNTRFSKSQLPALIQSARVELFTFEKITEEIRLVGRIDLIQDCTELKAAIEKAHWILGTWEAYFRKSGAA